MRHAVSLLHNMCVFHQSLMSTFKGLPQRLYNEIMHARRAAKRSEKVTLISLPDRHFLAMIGATKYALSEKIDWITKEEFT